MRFLPGAGWRQVENLDDDTLKAIVEAEVPSEHAALDLLSKDWTP